jgi:hypothetical protein
VRKNAFSPSHATAAPSPHRTSPLVPHEKQYSIAQSSTEQVKAATVKEILLPPFLYIGRGLKNSGTKVYAYWMICDRVGQKNLIGN